MDPNTKLLLENARTVHTVGPRPKELRPATKIISSLIKLGFLAGLVFVAWKSGSALVSSQPTARSAAVVTTVGKNSEDQGSRKHQQAHIRTEEDKGPNAKIITVLPEVKAQNTTASLPPILLSKNTAPQLVIDVKHTDTTPELAVKMWRAGQEFQAAALQAEGLELQPYYIEGDSTQPTIGVGYNIKMSVNTIGREAVRSELKQSGIDDAIIVKLLDPRQSVSSQAKITVPQALALLDVATHRFRSSTRAAVGAMYDKLPAHRQAALMWIDYNSNIHRRPELLKAVRSNQTHRAIEEMETWITVHGRRIRSPNIVLAQAMYWSKEGLQQVVMNPSKIKRDAANDIVMWQPTPMETSSMRSEAPTGGTTKSTVAPQANQAVVNSQDAVTQQVAASTRAQLAGLRNLRSVSPSVEADPPQHPASLPQTTPSGPEHQTSANQRRQWLNARNVRQTETQEVAPQTNGVR